MRRLFLPLIGTDFDNALEDDGGVSGWGSPDVRGGLDSATESYVTSDAYATLASLSTNTS